MKSKIILILIFALTTTVFSQEKITISQKKESRQYNKFVKKYLNSKNYRKKTIGISKKMKYSTPDKAAEQNFLLTMNPTLKRPTPEKLPAILKNVKKYREQSFLKNIPGSDELNSWVERGPNNVGGRTRGLMWEPNDAENKKVWAGGVSGGLWYNNDITDKNSSWISVNDMWANLAISCLAFDPTNKDIFYAGTGEGWSEQFVEGNGIWKTTDAGENWEQLPSTNNNIYFKYIQKIEVTETGRVLVATSNALLYSDDNGQTWKKAISFVFFADIEIASNGDIYTSNKFGDVFKSTNNGTSFSKVLDTMNSYRVEIAVAPSNQNVIYAISADISGNIAWFKKTTDAGENWSDITIPRYYNCNVQQSIGFGRGQAWYDLIIQVKPDDENTVFAGTIDLYRTTDGGNNWSIMSSWIEKCNYIPFIHADQHNILFRPNHNNHFIIGNDGGVFYTAGANLLYPNFSARNKNYNVTQFYTCAIHPEENKNFFLAGSQDNGTQQFNQNGVNETEEISGGDGAYCFIDKNEPNYKISSVYYNGFYRSVNNSFYEIIQYEKTGWFINPADYDSKENILYSAKDENSINRIKNMTGTVSISSIPVDINMYSPCTHIKVSPHTTSSTTLFVGTIDSKVLKITNANTDLPTTIKISEGLPNLGAISCIEIGNSEDTLIATFSNYGVESVWYSNNGGDSWQDKEGNLPDMPVRWALINPNNSNELILATEVGVWATENFQDEQPSWTPSNSGLANVRVDMLRMREADNEVIAATHGRGLFSSNAFNLNTSSIDETIKNTENEITISPNPNNGNFTVEMNNKKQGEFNVLIYNSKGQIVYNDKINKKTLQHSFSVNLSQKLETGIYIISLQNNKTLISKKFVIQK